MGERLLLGVLTRLGKRGGPSRSARDLSDDGVSLAPNEALAVGSEEGVDPQQVDGSSSNTHDAQAEALCAKARTEPQPFRRDALYREVARLMVTAHAADLRRYCSNQVGEGGDADDLAQRALLVLWEKLPGFEGRSRLRTYLFGIAANLCRQERRDAQRDAALIQKNFDAVLDRVHPDRHVAVDDELDAARRRRRVFAVLERLDPKDTWILRHRLVEQTDYHELLPHFRATFGPNISTVEGLRTQFFNAKGRLLRALEEADDGR